MSEDTDTGIEATARDVRNRIGSGVGRLQDDRSGGFSFDRGLANISSPFSVPTGESAGFLKALPVAGALMSLVEFAQGAGFEGIPVSDKEEQRGDGRKKKVRLPLKRPSFPLTSSLIGDDSKKTLLGQ